MRKEDYVTVEQLKKDAAAARKAGDEPTARYLERVIRHRKARLADVEGYEIVTDNPDEFPKETVEAQEQIKREKDTSLEVSDSATPATAKGSSRAKKVDTDALRTE